MVGYGAQVAYANLVQRLHGTKLAKAHTFTNWSARPLSNDQIAYALEDVEFLLSIHTHLRDRLNTLGRLEWVSEEFARLEMAVGEKVESRRNATNEFGVGHAQAQRSGGAS